MMVHEMVECGLICARDLSECDKNGDNSSFFKFAFSDIEAEEQTKEPRSKNWRTDQNNQRKKNSFRICSFQ